MIRDRALHPRETLVDKLPVTGELLRGSLLERIVRHKSGCPKCARGEATREVTVQLRVNASPNRVNAVRQLYYAVLRS